MLDSDYFTGSVLHLSRLCNNLLIIYRGFLCVRSRNILQTRSPHRLRDPPSQSSVCFVCGCQRDTQTHTSKPGRPYLKQEVHRLRQRSKVKQWFTDQPKFSFQKFSVSTCCPMSPFYYTVPAVLGSTQRDWTRLGFGTRHDVSGNAK